MNYSVYESISGLSQANTAVYLDSIVLIVY